MKITKTLIILLFTTVLTNAQLVKGKISDQNGAKLLGAIVQWQNNTNSSVFSDAEGSFEIKKTNTGSQYLVFKLLGYKTDSVKVATNLIVNITLKEDDAILKAVEIRGNSTIMDRMNPIQTEIITSKALLKAACCNLSESFETNASVSVSYTDAVTGAKQIQLLGLSGFYVQNNIENIPNLRGLASTFGLNYIPGTWIQSIDLGKGVGSVVNGYENMVGSMNVELQKPETSERLYVNAYVNNFGRAELNVNAKKILNDKWSVGLLTHGSLLKNRVDNNGDSFMDLPTYDQINVLNRWKYSSDRFMAQFGVKYLQENRLGGQNDFISRAATPNLYGFTNNTKRAEFFSKTAILFPDKPYRGLGLIINGISHKSDSYFGFKPYIATENTLYANLIYQDIFGNTNHSYRTGLSFMNDVYDENYGSLNLARNEVVPGMFFEYTYNRLDKTVLLLGVRNDFHNLYGNQFSPRIHFKQEIGQNDILRLSFGRGFRVPNSLADYFGNLVSSRTVKFLDKIQPEVTWTVGTSYTKEIGKVKLNAEANYTHFTKQWVADAEHPQYLYFYKSEGKAFNKSALIELNYDLSNRWDMKLAYRYTESKVTIGKPFDEKVLMDRMFLSRDRVLINVGYALPYDKWKMDATLQWNGRRRIPNTKAGYDHVSYFSMPITYAPSFVNVNSQITRSFRQYDVYLGAENLTGFRQKNPIIGSENPFGNNFDAGMAWGPIVGATVYTGFRFKLK